MGDNIFTAATEELEKSIKEENAEKQIPSETQDLGKAIVKGITDAVAPLLEKAHKGSPTSDLSAESDKRGTLLESGKDPAETPKKSGGGYGDSKSYTAEKASEDYNDDDMDEDDDDSKPSYFKKKKKKAKKKFSKSEDWADDEDSDDDDDGVYDASEFIDGVSEAVDDLGKSSQRLEDGIAVFGELLAELADPRRDKLQIALAKSLTYLTEKVSKLEKSIQEGNDLMKAVSQLPGVPKIAGMHLMKSEGQVEGNSGGIQVSKEDRDRLFKAACERRISTSEMKNAIATGDMSCLKKA